MDSDEYLVSPDEDKPDKKLKYWETAIGLQDVDGLRPSKYLYSVANRNIEGGLTHDEVERLLYDYHDNAGDQDEKEADIVSNRIAELLSEQGFSFSPVTLKVMHRRLFDGLYDHAGMFRDVNITKQEPILGGRSVIYGNYSEIDELLRYDFSSFDHSDLSVQDGNIRNLSRFVSSIWQIHPFREGNTRTIAIFIAKYLNSNGFQVDNAPFKFYSRYFRNALVRANFMASLEGVQMDRSYLDRFFENLILGKAHVLSNKDLVVTKLIPRESHLQCDEREPEKKP